MILYFDRATIFVSRSRSIPLDLDVP